VVNAEMASLNRTFSRPDGRATFVCECARTECVARLELTLEEYRQVRAHPARFIVAASPEHVFADVERLVEARGSYYVVEKIGRGAEIAAEAAQ
jgi:hypothetical protein